MIKNSILTMLILASTLQAGNLFSKLPYGIQMGKKVPSKVKRLMKHDVTEYYNVPYKFNIVFQTEEGNFVSGIYFDYEKGYTLPKKWRKAGIKLCNAYNKGTSYKQMKSIIKKDNAYEIEELLGKNEKIIKFRIDSDKKYYVSFGIEAEEHCKGGLNYIQVNDDDDDY